MTIDESSLGGKEVRLFPSHNINNKEEAEIRATASLLAVLRAVSEFGRAIVKKAGNPTSGNLRCYSEFTLPALPGEKDSKGRPDGVLRVTRGQKDWQALVEVKVGSENLVQEQFDRYHAWACEKGVNAFITISNQSAQANGHPPLNVDMRRKAVTVVHLSWEWLLRRAELLIRLGEVKDQDQRWILEEWIRYLLDPRSKIVRFPDLGDHWNHVLKCAHEGDLAICKNHLQDVVIYWDAFIRTAALRLQVKLEANVEQKMSKAEQKDPALIFKNLHDMAIKDGTLQGVLKIPDTAGDLTVAVLLHAKTVRYSIDVAAPTEGRIATRINWILKPLLSHNVPEDLLVKVCWKQKNLLSQKSIGELKKHVDPKEQVEKLMWDVNEQRLSADALPKSFSLVWTIPLPKCKGSSSVPVLEGIFKGMEVFYENVVGILKPYLPKAPQLQKEESTPETNPSPSQENTEPHPVTE